LPSQDDEALDLPRDPDIDLPDVAPLGAGGRGPRVRHPQRVIAVAIGVGGMVGAIARYSISLAMPTGAAEFPWSTLLVNVTGSAILGFVLVLLVEQFPRGRLARPIVGTGVIGAYTTFSTFEVDAVTLIRAGHPVTAGVYLVASVVVGLIAVWLGITTARALLQVEQRLQEEM